MNPAVAVGTTALVELWVASLLPAWAAWFPAWAGVSTGWLALAYGLRRPALLGKTHAPLVASALLAPVLLFAQGVARAAQRSPRHERQEIVPGLWVGGWPRPEDSPLAHLDLTAELPLQARPARYRNIPMLDGAPPHPDAWWAGVEQALAWRAEGHAVLIHCAYGHGRSVAVLVGVLVAEGWDADAEAALARVQAQRPRARLTEAQRAVVEAGLRRWRAERGAAAIGRGAASPGVDAGEGVLRSEA